jgi:hypothetical protein
MKFDAKTFFELTGKGGGPVAALGTAFGMPSCLINLTAEALAILPSPILRAIRGSTANGASRADDVIKAITAKLRFGWGIIEYDTEDGMFRFVSDSSKNGLDKDEGGILNGIGGFLGALGAAAGFGGRLYNNYLTTQAQINSIKECLDNYNDYLKFSGGFAGDERMRLAGISPERYRELVDQGFGVDKEELFDALQFKLRALESLQRIEAEMAARLSGQKPEPEFLPDYAEYVSGTGLEIGEQPQTERVKPIFRLSFGPPVSKEGKFILSKDGLYYDSQTSGIIPALLELESRKGGLQVNQLWNLEQDPSLGGRGRPINLDQFKSYVNTILDEDILDDSNVLQEYYLRDNVLQDLIGQKNRKIFDASSQLGDLESQGSSQILISNMRQVMLSEASHFLAKINKRKKQIELAVKLPIIYGKGTLYAPGQIPVNDFSYLEGINFQFDINRQKSLVLSQADVDSVVLPLDVKFIQQVDSSDPVSIDHLIINNIGYGSIVTSPSAVSANTLSLNIDVERDSLIAFYNYLTVEDSDTSSTFYLRNSSDLGDRLDAELWASSCSRAFDKGVGIVYLHGITKHSTSNPRVPSAMGSFIKLPPQPEFQDLIYNPKGATFETWVHAPQLDGEHYGFGDNYEVSGLYRLILANENTGLQGTGQTDILNIQRDNGTGVARGLLFGFTRDRRITTDDSPSNHSGDNRIEDACLFLAPTQSFDATSVGFVRKTSTSANCYSSSGWNCMRFSIWDATNGVSLSSCGKEFVQVALTFNPEMDQIKFYCDGKVLTTSSYLSVFGQSSKEGMPNIPSFKKNNSFEYNASSFSSIGVYEFSSGPKLDPYFTPWILGGGYTDGLQTSSVGDLDGTGNFMGGSYGGIISGLKGYLGSTKFYSKCLSDSEVLNNFNALKIFFKNIDVPNLMWEPISMG